MAFKKKVNTTTEVKPVESKLLGISKKTEVKPRKKYVPDIATPESLKKERLAAGRNQFIKFLNGEKINLREAIEAKCYDCMGFYADGVEPCASTNCPLYPFHPYNPNPTKLRASRPDLKGKKRVKKDA